VPFLDHLELTAGDAFRCHAPPFPFVITGRLGDIHDSVFDLGVMRFRENSHVALVDSHETNDAVFWIQLSWQTDID
jgi:hypothetical protein